GTYARSRRTSVLLPAIVGGTPAIGSAYAAFHLRRLAAQRFDLPARFLGLAEDASVVGARRAHAAAIARRSLARRDRHPSPRAARSGLPDRFGGLVEDAIVVGASRGLAEAIER